MNEKLDVDDSGSAPPPPLRTQQRRRSTAVTVLAGVVSAIALPALALFSGWFTAQYAEPLAVLIGLLLGGAGVAVGILVLRRLSGARVGGAAFLGVMAMGLALLATQQQTLSARGQEVDAVVTERSLAGSGTDRHVECDAVQRDGTPVEPSPRNSDCRNLRVGDQIRLLIDPEGQVRPLVVDGQRGSLFAGDSFLARLALPGAILAATAYGEFSR